MTRIHTGTSGYSYKEWKGSFYPEKLAAKDMLAHYAMKLPAVEINNTFYRMPKQDVVEGWAKAVPEAFRFAVKASMRITHHARLKNAEDAATFLFEQLAPMGDKLGIVLFQLPPNMKQSLERLEPFLAALPAGTRAAFEFRHESWFEESTYDCLRAHGCALVIGETDEECSPFVSTAPRTYLRLRRESYSDEELAEWAARVRGAGWDEAFVFFKHEDAGAGPRAAARFLELAS